MRSLGTFERDLFETARHSGESRNLPQYGRLKTPAFAGVTSTYADFHPPISTPERGAGWVPAFAGMTKKGMIFALLALAACGSRVPLTPQEGKSLPPKPLAAQETPTPQELMEPSAQSRPGRSDELLKQSKKREQDEFDLPPPG